MSAAGERWRELTQTLGLDPEDPACAALTLKPPPPSAQGATTPPPDATAPPPSATAPAPGADATLPWSPPASGEPRPAGQVDWRAEFQLGELLGAGGMGQVFRAAEPALGRDVAVKVLAAGAPAAFLAEARVTAYLDHPNVVPVYSLGEGPSGELHLVMKRIEGRPWSALLREDPPGEESGALGRHLEVLRGVLDALAFAHERGVLHRDLKPDNVMVGAYGEVYVVDWGLACALSEGPQRACGVPRASELEGQVAGTPCYMAPEMAEGLAPTRATDVYLLGALLHRLLVGRPPHQGASLLNVVSAALRNEVSPLTPSFPAPAGLVELAERCLRTDPSERFPSALELREALARFLSGEADRERSRELAAEAGEALSAAEREPDDPTRYRRLFAAEGLAQEALRRWPENATAQEQVAEIGAALVRCAMAAGDVGLAEAFLARVPAGERREELAQVLAVRQRQLDPKAASDLAHLRRELRPRLRALDWVGLAGAVGLPLVVWLSTPTLYTVVLALIWVGAGGLTFGHRARFEALDPTAREPYLLARKRLRQTALGYALCVGWGLFANEVLLPAPSTPAEQQVVRNAASMGIVLGFVGVPLLLGALIYGRKLGERDALFAELDWRSLARGGEGRELIPQLLDALLPAEPDQRWHRPPIESKALARALTAYAPDLAVEDVLALGDATLFGKVQGCLLTRAGLRQRREGNEWRLGWDEVSSARRASGWPSYKIEIGARSGETRVLECDGFSHAQRGLVRLLERVALLNGEPESGAPDPAG